MGKMVREDKSTWKANYFTKIVQLLDEYPKCFLVEADNVGSKQMQQIRMSLRGHAVVLMGKHHDAQGYPWPLGQQPQVGVLDEPHQGQRWFRLHQGGFGQHQGHAFGQQGQGPRQSWCPCSIGRTGSRSKHWIGSRKDLFLPSCEHPYQNY